MWHLHFDSTDNKPYMSCQEIEPLLSYIFAPGPWKASTTREAFQEAFQESQTNVLILTAGETASITIWVVYQSDKEPPKPENPIKAYVMYNNDGFYLAFGKNAVEASKGISGEDWQSLSVQESHPVEASKAYRMQKEHGYFSLKEINV